MSRALARILPRVLRNDMWDNPVQRAMTPFGSSWIAGPDYFDREFRHLENMMNRMQNEMWRTFDGFSPSSSQSRDPTRNLFRIVEEDGKQKVRVQFDAENMKPEDIQVKTSGNTLEISAKTEEKGDYHSIYQEYCRRLTLPEGVKPEELTCNFENGVVTLEAPYSPPVVEAETKKVDGPQAIPISHEQNQEQGRQEIPVARQEANERQKQSA